MINRATAILLFYEISLLDKMKGYSRNPPLDIVSIAPPGKEYEKVGRIYQIKGRIGFELKTQTVEEIAKDFAERFGTNGASWQSFD